MDLTVRKPDYGLDATFEDAVSLPDRAAADNSQNVIYENGLIKTPRGYAKVGSGDLPLDSGSPILAHTIFPEPDKTEHWIIATRDTIQERDYRNNGWTDLTQSGQDFGANEYNPVSFASMLHTDGLALNGSGDSAYNHVVCCNGGLTPIQRWAGKHETDFADLLGADGYHDTSSGRSTHYALQVGAYQSHFILINPKEANATNILIENNQRVRWSVTGKLETWTGDYSGYKDLVDTGGYNVWSALLREQYTVYQNNSIWSMNHVGGTDVFDPLIEIPNLGLKGPHLICAKNNVHYFVGDDYNVYAYTGGGEFHVIGKKIQRYLERDMRADYAYRSWIAMGPKSKRLWIFIVPSGKTFCTEAYIIDVRSGAWMKRDFTNKFSSGGISSVFLVGATDYVAGDSYQAKLLETSPEKNVAIGGLVRSSNVVTGTTDVPHSFIAGETVTIADCDSGSETDAFDGDHTIASVPTTTTFTFSQSGADESNLAAGTAQVDKPPTSQDYINSGVTSLQALQTTLTDEELTIGDNSGYIYQFDDDESKDDGNDISAVHVTKVFDLGQARSHKIWPALSIIAKGTSVTVSYRTGNFETESTGWTSLGAQTLTSEFVEYVLTINDTSKKIQFKFTGADFEISEFVIHEPAILGSV